MLEITSIRPAISSYLQYTYKTVCVSLHVCACVCLYLCVSNKISAGSAQRGVIPSWNVLKALNILPPAQNSVSISQNLLTRSLILFFPWKSLSLISICHYIAFIRCHLQLTSVRHTFEILSTYLLVHFKWVMIENKAMQNKNNNINMCLY